MVIPCFNDGLLPSASHPLLICPKFLRAHMRKLTFACYDVAHAVRNGHHKIMIQTVDTDVVVLALAVAQGLKARGELWLAFGKSL